MKTKMKGLTKTLLFAVLSVGFGSSFLYGFNIGVINTPQTVMGLWIRELRCKQLSEVNEPLPEMAMNKSSNQTSSLWCGKLDQKRQETMFKKNYQLNLIWTTIASIFCVGGLLGSLVSNILVGKFGRKRVLLLNNATGILAAILLAAPYFVNSIVMLVVGRFIAGLNGGITSAVAPLYMTEIPPLNLRGALGGFHQFFIVFAILIAQCLGHPAVLGNATRWPYLFGFGLLPCIFQLCTLPFCPESPKFLYLTKNKDQKAKKALKQLRGKNHYEDELDELRDTREDTQDEKQNYSILDLFRDPLLRKLTVMAMIMTSSGHASGHGTVIYYSTSVFVSAGIAKDMAVYATMGMGALYALSTFCTAAMVEKAGRKCLMLIGLGGMCLLTTLLTVFIVLFQQSHPTPDHLSDAVEAGDSAYDWTPYASIVCVYLHTIIYAVGPGTIPAFLVSEMFTQGPRAAATSIALATNWVANLAVVLAFPLVQAKIEGYTFIIFSVLLAMYFFYTWWRIPETKGKQTEEIIAELKERT